MDPGGFIRTCLLLVVSGWLVAAKPISTTTIECGADTNIVLGAVDEGYTGDVEVVNGITPGTGVKLKPYLFDGHLEFLDLNFTLGQTSATVHTKKPLDADKLAATDSTLYYSIVCDGFDKYNNIRTLKINDLNDNGPVFRQKLYSSRVSETKPVDTEVLRVEAVDADSTTENNTVTYIIVEQPTEDFMVTNAGTIILMRRLNYNRVQQYNFTVMAKDKFGLNDTAAVQITVEDFDNFNPYFSHNLYQAFIPENQKGSFSAIQPEAIKAQDGDKGINMTLTYSISAVSPDKYRGNFNIDSGSGVLSVVDPFDREEMNTSVIFVSIEAAQTDDSLKTAAVLVSVTVEDVNDNVPEFDKTFYSVTLLENSPVDTVVFKAIVTDLDQGGFVGTLLIPSESSPFSIDSDGTVRVKNSTYLDRETRESFSFRIEARERDPPNRIPFAEVKVTLLDENDNSPEFTSNIYKGKVYANQTEGMLLVQVKAEDPDAGANGQIKYFLDFGNDNEYFSLNDSSGEISLAKPIPLLENAASEFLLYITAKDGGLVSRSSSTVVKISTHTDSKPQFVQNLYYGTVAEEQIPEVVILTVNFHKVNTETPVTLRVETEADKFAISPNGDFYTKAKLDFDEAPHNYSVVVSLSDGSNRDTARVVVQVTDINDNSPAFASSSVNKSVPEDAKVGSNVTVVSATDKDSSFNKEIRYSLRGGEGRFSIDPVSGLVSVAGALDRETEAEYSMLVVAVDQGCPARSASATLLVQVSDVNDNFPKFSQVEYQVEVLETESAGKSLLTLSAKDPDDGANGRVTYSISQQVPPSDPAVFEVDPSSGILRLVQPLDYSEVKLYNLTVQASDGGAPSLDEIGSVVVKVKDVNNNPPEFSKEIYDVAVSENLASGASILTLEVTDRDEGGFSNGYFLYFNETFDINKQGVVSLRKDVTLDRETTDSYILQVVAVDQLTDGLRATAQLNVTVLDYNDNAPRFPAIPDPLRIPEGDYSEESPGEVFTIVATDADLGLSGEVVLSLAHPHPLFRFREDGTLLAVGPLDRESRETYELLVKASDRGIPQRENVTSIRVSVSDVNDNRPEFSSSSYVSSVLLKDAEEGKLLLTLSASDRDAGDNSLITYSFCEGNSPYLALNNETGAVILTSDLADVTEDTMLELTAMAKDHGRPALNSTARVVVNLRTVSLVEGVAFQRSSYNFSLPENQPAGVVAGRVRASSGSDLYDVAYALKSHADLFSVNASGAILTRAPLDKEEQEWYILDVEAVDTRTPPTSAIAMVRVQVEDVNEAPQFPSELYKASIFSIAPYKTPVARVKATDPDLGDGGQLVYSLSDSPHLDVDPSSGLVYVVSAAAAAGQTTAVEVMATDPRGLRATARLEVAVEGKANSGDVVTISLNQPANTVEKKVPDLEKAVGAALGWTVNVIEVSSSDGGAVESRAPRTDFRTLVGLIATDGAGEVVPSEEVTKKLQSQSAAVRTELVKVFGEGLVFNLAEKPQSPASNQAAVIALGVLLGLSVVGLIVAITLIIRFKRQEKEQDCDNESFGIDQLDKSHELVSEKL